MFDEKIKSFEIIRHHKFSWSYIYTINGKKRSLSGTSISELKKFVLEKGLPWDEENYPTESITKSQYDNDERIPNLKEHTHEPKEYTSKSFEEETRHHESLQLPRWVPSMKKRERNEPWNL